MKRQAGFTLIELVVAITISAIVLIFVTMFMTAPVDAYETQSRRNAMVADASSAWPRMDADLRAALPNSVRARRNGSFVVLEMLHVVDVARYMTAPTGTFNTAGVFRGIPLPFVSNTHYLSVNNRGTAGVNAYALTDTITTPGTIIQIAAGPLGETVVTAATAFTGNSPRQLIYLVSGPVTYLCDEGQGTMRRYENYAITLSQTARDAPADFPGTGELVARGLTTCNFTFSAPGAATSQTVAARITSTRNGETVNMLHTVRAEYTP